MRYHLRRVAVVAGLAAATMVLGASSAAASGDHGSTRLEAFGRCDPLATACHGRRVRAAAQSDCYLNPYRLTRYFFRAAGDAKQSCTTAITTQGLFVQLFEFWKSTQSWHLMKTSGVSKGGPGSTITAGATRACRTAATTYWSLHARGFFELNGVWYAQTKTKTDYLNCS